MTRCAACAPARSTTGSKQLGAFFYEGAGWERPAWFEANAELAQRLRGDGLAVPGARRLVVAVLVADLDRRGALDPRAGRDVRHDAADPLRGRRRRARRRSCSGCPPTTSTRASGRSPTRCCSTKTAASEAISPSPGSPTPGSRSPSTGRWTSTGSAGTCPDDVTLRDITGGTCCVGVWGPRARDMVAAAVPRRPVAREVQVLPRTADLPRRDPRHDAAGVLCRRAGLGDLHERRIRCRAVGSAVRRGPAPRA